MMIEGLTCDIVRRGHYLCGLAKQWLLGSRYYVVLTDQYKLAEWLPTILKMNADTFRTIDCIKVLTEIFWMPV